jgi:tetratricopeptide (TPR) repeat protein
MEGRRVSHYDILEPLGSGGMGEVYRARDIRLGRDVALKFLSAPMTRDATARERFAAEARALSALDHPNVCAVYDVGETDDGRRFIAMAYCPGKTLEQRLEAGALEVEEAVRIGAQLARGLAGAHESGVIHRDLKPGNVVIDDRGHARIIDFGVARMADTALTSPGGTVGTAAYMAPEQVRGEPVGAAADIWALGVLLYRMVAGRLPFAAPYEQAMSYRILHEDPDALAIAGRDGQDFRTLEDLIAACLEKDPADRPHSMADIAETLEALLPAPVPKGGTVPTRSRFARALRGQSGRLAAIAGAAAVLVLAGVLMLTGGASAVPGEKYLVVLPFIPTDGAGEDALLFEGLTATLTNRLAQLASYTDDAYWVVPHSEVRLRSVTTPSAARRVFGATLALEATAVRVGSGVRLHLSLIDTRTLKTLRAAEIDVPSERLGRIEEDASRRLAGMMEVTLRPESRLALAAGSTGDPDAYNLYLQGRAHLQRFELKENLDAAVRLLRRAVDLDPRFGTAFAALGEAHWRLYEMTKDEIHIPLAVRNLEQALAIDRRLSEAHVTLARLHAGTGRAEEALAAIDRAILLEPASADAYLVLGRILDRAEQPDEAEGAFQQAIAMRPGYWAGYNDLGGFYYRRGRYEEAATQYGRVVVLTPDNVRGHSNLGAVRFHMEQFEEAARSFEASVALEPTYAALSNLASLYFFMGEMDRAARTYRSALDIQDGDYRLWLNKASAHHELGREEERRRALMQAIRLADRQLQLNPADQDVRIDLARALASVGDHVRSLEMLRSFEGEPIGNIEIKYQIGMGFELVGERATAVDWLCRALESGYSEALLQRSPALEDLRADPASSRLTRCVPSG